MVLICSHYFEIFKIYRKLLTQTHFDMYLIILDNKCIDLPRVRQLLCDWMLVLYECLPFVVDLVYFVDSNEETQNCWILCNLTLFRCDHPYHFHLIR
jgi:hypothetical protein